LDASRRRAPVSQPRLLPFEHEIPSGTYLLYDCVCGMADLPVPMLIAPEQMAHE
jgi:hypothetical protein